eukprot:TRINITY_DN8576_c0_g1_i2.p1 TRINITY_DN8576_c0_g1~~TRINITY_DN8576_c0_g1_i2.p1  ORF type:complete len:144 (+),score=33.00 TRINITY_DN8576_c0_g1_i2:622-1053(+)
MEKVKPENRRKYESLQRAVEAGGARNEAESVLGLYLREVGQKVKREFYKTIIIFVRLYAECLNECGWELAEKEQELITERGEGDFIKRTNTANFIPEACNKFVNYYLPENFPTFNHFLAVEMIRHLCDWLYKNNYTTKHIILM